MSNDRDDVTNRLKDRFEDNQEGENEPNDRNSQNEQSSRSSMKSLNVKKEWNAKTVYLSDDLDDRLTKQFKRLDLELDDDLENLKKTRHFYPLVVQAGLDRIDSMERNELLERIERNERKP